MTKYVLIYLCTIQVPFLQKLARAGQLLLHGDLRGRVLCQAKRHESEIFLRGKKIFFQFNDQGTQSYKA